ncbi:hypothetical protein DX873_12830 [Flagellimonas nanhaiensis]|uniref:Uncharacterized protein n=2 Tax=Flagellimonas nanhaiensis TaxID=2292706 RepID=A0A371JRT2_9FLAO|nr:hypothetical protein DX873_12830 [Allomuricauda nanhaiensis]
MFQGHAQTKLVDDLMVFDPPSEKFVSIVLQTHKGLPRFGVLNDYRPKSKNSNMRTMPSRGRQSPENVEKIGRARTGLRNLSIMLGLNYRAPFLTDLDRERLTTPSSSLPQEQQNSAYLQNYLLRQVAPNICLDESCKNANQGKNEFERLRNYKSFMDNCFGSLQEWSKDFLKNDELVGYHVSLLHVARGYDFDKKGYWVSHNFNMNDVFAAKVGGAKKVIFEPVAAYENQMAKNLDARNGVQFFLKVDEASAERFMKEGINWLYLVKKIKLKYSGKTLSQPRDPIEFNYAHEDSKLLIYEDAALTKNFTTISLDNLTLKKP